jgi:hypothetical protein
MGVEVRDKQAEHDKTPINEQQFLASESVSEDVEAAPISGVFAPQRERRVLAQAQLIIRPSELPRRQRRIRIDRLYAHDEEEQHVV